MTILQFREEGEAGRQPVNILENGSYGNDGKSPLPLISI